MRASVALAFLACLVAQGAADRAQTGPEVDARARWAEVAGDRELPPDLRDPEGRTSWDLRQLVAGRSWIRSVSHLAGNPGAIEVVDAGRTATPAVPERRRYSAASGVPDLERWLLPAEDPNLLDPSPGRPLELLEEGNGAPARLRITTRRVGMGWLHLPSGPREVVLQRALVMRAPVGGSGYVPESLVHRFIDPRAGIVAEIRGPVSADGRSRLAVDHVEWIEQPLTPQAGLRIYDFQMDPPVLTRVTYGYDRRGVCTVGGNACVSTDDCVAGGGDACNIPVSVLTPDHHATIGALIAAPAWDFSGNGLAQQRFEVAQSISPVSLAETCSAGQCGFNRPGVKLGRQDKNFDDPPNADITTTVLERELRTDPLGQPTDVTLWLRAGVNKEGQTGSLGDGESRICYVEDGRTGVPLWRFPHQDSTGWYWMLGDSWSSDSNPSTPAADPFLCENTIFVHTCPNSCGLFCRNWIRDCSGYSGTQGSAVVGEGPVTLPSGHTFNALLVRNTAEFCVYIGSACSSPVFRVRTVVYLWEVPWLGTVVRLTSAQNVADFTSFTSVEETDIKFGPFPPLAIAVGAVTDTSVEVDWDPGLDTHRIDGFKVYWSTTSGSYTDANSLVQPAAMGSSAVVPDLLPGTTYYFTVTALSDFTNPKTLVTTTYESLKFPLTTSALPQPVPMEVSATTSGGVCVPTAEVLHLTASKPFFGAEEIELCWDPVSDPCLSGYQILGAASPASDTNFTPEVDDMSLATCRTFLPVGSFFLVVAKGSGGTGPWGHFGH